MIITPHPFQPTHTHTQTKGTKLLMGWGFGLFGYLGSYVSQYS